MKWKYKIPRKRKAVRQVLSKNQQTGVKQIVERKLKQNVELKQHAVSIGATEFYSGTAGTDIDLLTDMTQNITDTTRLGDEITLKSIELMMFFYNPSTAVSIPYSNVRVIVFQYIADPATAPAIAKMFLVSNASGGDYGAMNSFNQDYVPSIYHILYDKLFHLSVGTTNAANYGATPSYAKQLRFKVPLKYAKKKLQFISAGATLTNGIYLLVTASQGATTDNAVYLYNATIKYTDS